MATVTISIPDKLVPELTEAIRAGWPEHVELGPAAAFRAITADYWRGVLREHRRKGAADAAQETLAAVVIAAEQDAAGIG